jgi:sodium/pantothenate symporter
MFAAIWGPVALKSVWSKRITEAGAFWGMVAGFVGFIGPKILTTLDIITLPVYSDPLLLGFFASLLTAILVSRYSDLSSEEAAYRESLHIAPPEMSDVKAMRRTLMWPKLMMIWGVAAAILLIVVYVRPYQLARGLVTNDGAYVIWSGELVVALLFGSAIFLAGAAARFVMLRVDRGSSVIE